MGLIVGGGFSSVGCGRRSGRGLWRCRFRGFGWRLLGRLLDLYWRSLDNVQLLGLLLNWRRLRLLLLLLLLRLLLNGLRCDDYVRLLGLYFGGSGLVLELR